MKMNTKRIINVKIVLIKKQFYDEMLAMVTILP